MRRRDFLKSAGCFVASAAVPLWSGCGDDDDNPGDGGDGGSGTYAFPHGVAAGDPQPSSLVLWTRVVDGRDDADGSAAIELSIEVSKTADFKELVIDKKLRATRASDFTVRVLATDLEAGSIYHYRFRAGSALSRVGRARTAPASEADVDVRFAWVSCQDYSANFYGSYRQLLNDDADKPEDEQIQFVLHVGDFIYETRDAGFMQARDENLERISLESKSGKPRVVPEFPSGGGTASSGASFAETVEDYRHVYKTYLEDVDLQDARARWAFICVWDDHEFCDDCWQSQANYDRRGTTDEPSQKRRVAASQAWSEYIPSALTDHSPVGEVASEARDFAAVRVEDAEYGDVVDVKEPNNRSAIGAITIYRNLRFGKHMELVLTDSRSYRSDHALAEELTSSDLFSFHPRAALPLVAVNVADAGNSANGGQPPDKAGTFDNLRKNEPPGTMLGAKQKQWWKDVMAASDATWKVWGNSVPLLRIVLDSSEVDLLKPRGPLLLSPDAWDGYNTERKELMAHLKDRDVLNVVSLSGDHHAHYAGVVLDDYDAPSPSPVMVDLATAAISSASQFVEIASAFDASIPAELEAVADGVRKVIVYDSTPLGGTEKAVPNMNTLIRYGSAAANEAAASHDLAKIEAARNPEINKHLRYADSRATGFALAHVSAERLEATLVTIERSFEDLGKSSPGIRGTARFTIPKVAALSEVTLPEPTLTGKKPFPLA
jgi:alkaline phosphatase D